MEEMKEGGAEAGVLVEGCEPSWRWETMRKRRTGQSHIHPWQPDMVAASPNPEYIGASEARRLVAGHHGS